MVLDRLARSLANAVDVDGHLWESVELGVILGSARDLDSGAVHVELAVAHLVGPGPGHGHLAVGELRGNGERQGRANRLCVGWHEVTSARGDVWAATLP